MKFLEVSLIIIIISDSEDGRLVPTLVLNSEESPVNRFLFYIVFHFWISVSLDHTSFSSVYTSHDLPSCEVIVSSNVLFPTFRTSYYKCTISLCLPLKITSIYTPNCISGSFRLFLLSTFYSSTLLMD